MPDNILVIRSVSVQQMGSVMEAIQNAHPEADVDIVTHGNMAGSIRRAYPDCGLIEYPGKGNYFWPVFLRLLSGRGKKYGAVYVPVANIGGSGYGNVMTCAAMTALFFGTGGARAGIVNVNAGITGSTAAAILAGSAGRLILSLMALVAAVPLFAAGCGYLLLMYTARNSVETDR